MTLSSLAPGMASNKQDIPSEARRQNSDQVLPSSARTFINLKPAGMPTLSPITTAAARSRDERALSMDNSVICATDGHFRPQRGSQPAIAIVGSKDSWRRRRD